MDIQRGKILIIGADSTIGSGLIDLLRRCHIDAVGTTRRERHHHFEGIRSLDLASIDSIRRFVLDDIGYAVLLAGVSNISFCHHHPEAARQINVIGSGAIVERLRVLNIPCLLVSSSSVFHEQAVEVSESSLREPSCVYGLQKKELEDIIAQSDLNLILRVNKVWGVGSGILRSWRQILEQGMPIHAFYDLPVAPLHINSVCNYLMEAVTNSYRGVSHLSTDSQVSYFEMAKRYCRFLDLDSERHVVSLSCKCDPRVLYQPKRAYLDCVAPASRILSLEEEISRVISDTGMEQAVQLPKQLS